MCISAQYCTRKAESGRKEEWVASRAKEVGHVEAKLWWCGAGEPICMEAPLPACMAQNVGQN